MTYFDLYLSIKNCPYIHIMSSTNLNDLFLPLDILIVSKGVPDLSYYILCTNGVTNSLVHKGDGSKDEYLSFKNERPKEYVKRRC